MKNSKLQAPSSKEALSLKPQTDGAESLKFGAWNFSGAWRLVVGAFFAGIALLPGRAVACVTCYGGNIDSSMADGMNWGIFTLLGVVGTVLAAFLTFLIYAIRKSEAMNAAAEQKNSPKVSNV